MRQKVEYIVRTVAFILIVWGLYEIIAESEGTWLLLRYGLFSSDTDSEIRWYHVLLLLLFSVVIPLIAIVSGWGMLKLHRWAHPLALGLSAFMFVLTFYGTMDFAVRSYYLRNVPIPPIPEGAVVGYYSMWPTYITALGSGALFLLLGRGSVKKLFVGKSRV